MIIVTVRDGDVEGALRRLRRLRDRSGLTREAIRQEEYTKPGERRRLKALLARRRARRQDQRQVRREVARGE